MLLNSFYYIVLISAYFLGGVHSEVIASISPSKTLTSTPRKACSIPESPEYIYVSLEGNRLDREKCYDGSGQFVARVNCFDDTKIIEPDNFAICFDGTWFPSIHNCVMRKCQPVNDTLLTRHTCKTPEGDEVSCREPAVPGTKVTIRCAHWRYGFENFVESTVLDRFCQKSGQWQTLEKCKVLSCRTRSPVTSNNNSLLETNSSSSLKIANYFPWNAIIYGRNNDGLYQLCLGTVITNRLVLTSGKCFPNHYEEFVKIPQKGDLRVAVGKYFKNYKDYDQGQMYDVTRINFSLLFGYSTVIVSRHIEFSDSVGFACLGVHPSISHLVGKVGYILVTRDGNQSALPLTIQQCQISEAISSKLPKGGQFFCSPTNNHTFGTDELGGGLILGLFEDSDVYPVGLLYDLLLGGQSPIFLDIAHLQTRVFIEKSVEDFHYWIGERNENWPRKWGQL